MENLLGGEGVGGDIEIAMLTGMGQAAVLLAEIGLLIFGWPTLADGL